MAIELEQSVEISRHGELDDLELATDAPGFGLELETPSPESAESTPEPADTAPERDDKGRFVGKEDEPAAEEPPADETTAEVVEETPETPAEPPKKDSPEELARKKVPYTRFKEAVEKEREKARALAERLAAAEQRLQQQDAVDIDDSQLTRIADLLIEGKTEEYAKGLKDILQQAVQTGVKMAEERAVARSQMEVTQLSVEQERAQAAQHWASQYDVFNPASPNFDQGLTEEAVAIRDAYEGRGFTPAEALARAVKVVVGMYGLEAPEPATEVAPVAAPKVDPVKRRAEAERKATVAAAQPPRVASGDVDQPSSLLKRVATMTPEEFDKLSEEDLERLRYGIGG